MSARCCWGATRLRWPGRATEHSTPWPAIVVITAGAALGAACFAATGRWSLVLPAGLALCALALGLAARREVSRQQKRIDQQRRNAHSPETNDGDHAMNDQAGVYAGKVVPGRGGKE